MRHLRHFAWTLLRGCSMHLNGTTAGSLMSGSFQETLLTPRPSSHGLKDLSNIVVKVAHVLETDRAVPKGSVSVEEWRVQPARPASTTGT